ncbi:hypothetical protein [Negadavirga shengliensis]|uniref:Sulfite dehydrogenase (Cytochrome) subunit SorB n=1 Tax=Negadavirga shengliensis TaxID=1389218 RepID=A0ABV9SYR8_9BACT
MPFFRRNNLKTSWGILIALVVLVLALIGFVIYLQTDPDFSSFYKEEKQESPIPLDEIEDRIEDGIHVQTGLVADEGLHLVIANCTACHSAMLITQNRADRDGWKKMIRWMQETQNLWDLGANEEIILNYLSQNYAPKKRGRRAPLTDIEWYELK